MTYLATAARAPRGLTLLIAGTATALALVACSPDTTAEKSGSSETTRTVEHARGSTEVPTSPERIVVLEPVQLDTAVALDMAPVGAAVASEETGVPAYLGDVAQDITPVGTVTEPALEKIAEQKPDLIIGTESRHSDLYEQLSSIAPTVFMATQEDPWPVNVKLVGEALNRADDARALLDDYNERCAQIAKKYDVKGTTAQLVRPRDEAVLSIYGPTSFAGSTLECVGFTIPDRDWEESISVDISPELIMEARGDQVFVTTDDVKDKQSVPAPIRDNAKSFPNVHLVDFSYWIAGVGPKGGQVVLDDVESILAEAQ